MKLMRAAIASLLVLSLFGAGCATRPSSPTSAPSSPSQPPVNLSGYNAAFRQGYADGCESARSALPRQDERRFRNDGDYAVGWNDGYSSCKRRAK